MLLGDASGCLGNVWWVSGVIWVVFMEIGGTQMCLGGIWVLSPCSMEPKHSFGTALKSMTCFHLTILRHQNIKMSISKLNKNGWVLPFLCFLVSVRTIWKITVANDHPVAFQVGHKSNISTFFVINARIYCRSQKCQIKKDESDKKSVNKLVLNGKIFSL